MNTSEKNAQKNIEKLVAGYVVAASDGSVWLTIDVNTPDDFVFMNWRENRTDWAITDTDVFQEELNIPDEDGGTIKRLCMYSKNENTGAPYVEEDLKYCQLSDFGGFISKS